MARQLMRTKRGMVQVYDKEGNPLVCTLLHVEPNVITQIKTLEKDKYEAIQLGYS
jgi:large subunit ribosomal protein L3